MNACNNVLVKAVHTYEQVSYWLKWLELCRRSIAEAMWATPLFSLFGSPAQPLYQQVIANVILIVGLIVIPLFVADSIPKLHLEPHEMVAFIFCFAMGMVTWCFVTRGAVTWCFTEHTTPQGAEYAADADEMQVDRTLSTRSVSTTASSIGADSFKMEYPSKAIVRMPGDGDLVAVP